MGNQIFPTKNEMGDNKIDNRLIVLTDTVKEKQGYAEVEKKDNENIDKIQKITLQLPNILEVLRKLKCTGTIMKEDPNNFWVIKMNDEWQNKQEELVEIMQMDLKVNDSVAYNDSFDKADELARKWAKKLNIKENSYMKYGFFSPASEIGVHISLGKFEPADKPQCLIEGTVVSFSIGKFATFGTNWKRPTVIPGQREFKLPASGEAVLRHFATQWYKVNVDVHDFDFKFKLPPHISLACYGLMYAPTEEALRWSLRDTGSRENSYEYGKTQLP